MNSQQAIGFVVLALGFILLFLGINAANSPAERVVEGVTGHYTDRTNWYLIGGMVAIVAGAVMAFLGSRRLTT